MKENNFYWILFLLLLPFAVAWTLYFCCNAEPPKTMYKLRVQQVATYPNGKTRCDTVIMSNHTYDAVKRRPALNWYEYTLIDTVR